jgi:hypothetical protein
MVGEKTGGSDGAHEEQGFRFDEWKDEKPNFEGKASDLKRGVDAKREVKPNFAMPTGDESSKRKYVRVPEETLIIFDKALGVLEEMVVVAVKRLELIDVKFMRMAELMKQAAGHVEALASGNKIIEQNALQWLREAVNTSNEIMAEIRAERVSIEGQWASMTSYVQNTREVVQSMLKRGEEERAYERPAAQKVEEVGRKEAPKAAENTAGREQAKPRTATEVRVPPKAAAENAGAKSAGEARAPPASNGERAEFEMPRRFTERQSTGSDGTRRGPYEERARSRSAQVWVRAWKWALGIVAAIVIGAGLMFAGSKLPSVQQAMQQSTRPAVVQVQEKSADADELRLEKLGVERQAALGATGYSVQVEGIRDAQKAPVLQIEIEQAYRADVKALEGMRGKEAQVAAYESWTGRIAQIAPEHVKAHAGMDSAFGAGGVTKAHYWQEHRELERIFKQLAKGRGEMAKQRYGEFGRKVAGAR